MKLRNLSGAKFDITIRKGHSVELESVAPGAELVVREDHPPALKLLAEQYPKEWVVVEEKKLSKAELNAELKKREAEEAAEKKAEADAAKPKEEKKKDDKKGE